MGTIVVYHFEMSSANATAHSRSKRPATREAIEALGFTPLMETAEIVERSQLDGNGFVRPELRSE
jgi:hypothetical protein